MQPITYGHKHTLKSSTDKTCYYYAITLTVFENRLNNKLRIALCDAVSCGYA